MRTDGHVRYLRLGAGVQRKAATVALGALGVWLGGTAGLIGWQAWSSWQNRDMADRAVALAQAEVRVAAERRSAEQIARDVESRQKQLEGLFKSHFGEDADAAGQPEAATPPASHPPAQASTPSAGAAVAQPAALSVADPAGRLKAMDARQHQLVAAMTQAAARRTARAEDALRAVGLQTGGRRTPASGMGSRLAQGGPFLPWLARREKPLTDPALKRLEAELLRMEAVESLIVALPSGSPAEGMETTSGFGTRFDPFNGQRAVHAGIDFRGPHGSPIRAAAAGRVSFVGVKSGYGNVVEVDHGHGLLTRYAHLSGFASRVGDAVESGETIARMGSTGRSTGTHLHFEVRVNGTAVNPRRFLEANAHVLEVKADAHSRVAGRAAAA